MSWENEDTSPGTDDEDERLFSRSRLALAVLEPPSWTLSVYPLADKGRVRLGRGEEAEIQVSDHLVSRLQAELECGEPGSPAPFIVKDLGSRNGTRIGERRLAAGERLPVALGEVITFGGTCVVPIAGTFSSDDRSWPEPALAQISEVARMAALTNLSLVIQGETGVGKERLSQIIHQLSPRRERPLVVINCATLSDSSASSDLFGHLRGLTPGLGARTGALDRAQGGTVVLDEVCNLPTSVQAGLLRVMQEREIAPLGAERPHPIDVRFIAVSNRPLREEVERGRFRADLWARMCAIQIDVPPLRARRHVIPHLANTFLQQGLADHPDFRGRESGISSSAMLALLRYDWPRNVRELQHVIARAMLVARGGLVQSEHLGLRQQDDHDYLRSLDRDPSAEVVPVREDPATRDPSDLGSEPEKERALIIRALASNGGNQTRTAKALGMARRTLASRLDKYQIPRPRRRETS